MEELFKGIDAYEREFVGYPKDRIEYQEDDIMYCQDSMYTMLLINDLLDKENLF